MIAPLHFLPRVPLAWRILTYDKRRTGLALIGIFMAILLVFVELGFFYAVPRGGLLLYDNMGFDLLLASDEYEYQAQPGTFPLGRLDPVRSSPDVQRATPIYFAFAKWKSGEGGVWPDVFVIGFDPASHIFIPDSINRQTGVLERADTVLVDSATRPMFGPLDTGRVVEIGDRKITIGGQYVLGTGFMGLGVVLASAANFARLFPQRGLNIVNFATIQLKPGVDPDRAADNLRKVVGSGLQVFTRKALEARETAYWTTRTSVGIIFGSGLLISFVVDPGQPAAAAIRNPEGDRLSRPVSGRHGQRDVAVDCDRWVHPGIGRRSRSLFGNPPGDVVAGGDERNAPPRGVRRRRRDGVDVGAPLCRQSAPRCPGGRFLRGVGLCRLPFPPSDTRQRGSPE